jgi:hypothetical protein
MKKFALILVAALALGGIAFSEPILQNGMLIKAPGSLNATIGYDFGAGLNVGLEEPIGHFDVQKLRFSYGVKEVGSFDFWLYGTTYQIGVVGTIHFAWGCLDLPSGLAWLKNIDTFSGIGLGYTGVSYNDGYTSGATGGLGFIGIGGSSYFFNRAFALTVAGGAGGSYIGLLWKF